MNIRIFSMGACGSEKPPRPVITPRDRIGWGKTLPIVGSLIGILISAPLYSATPSVLAGGQPYGGSFGSNTAESPTTPLTVSYSDSVGLNTVFGSAVPGRLKASSEIVGGINPWDQSLGRASFIDHFLLSHPGKPDNSTGTFTYTFFLTGTMKIKQDGGGVAAVSVIAFTFFSEDPVGYLEVSQQGSIARLYAIGGESGGPYPLNNIFAEPDGSIKIYATASATGGYFTFPVRFRVDFTFTNFPYNKVPSMADFDNYIQFDLAAISFKNAQSDFSATFELAEQNPIVPDPMDPNLPTSGWDFSSASGEIPLPEPLHVATATATGDAGFGSEFGSIENLMALDESAFPVSSLANAQFPHGFFSLDISGLQSGEVTGVGITLPGPVAPDTSWWFYDSMTGWSTLPTIPVPGTGFLLITAGDGLAGDFSDLGGTINLVGGPSIVEIIFANGFETN